MSLTMFLAFAILGCDFLLYALFQWIYASPLARNAAPFLPNNPIMLAYSRFPNAPCTTAPATSDRGLRLWPDHRQAKQTLKRIEVPIPVQ